MSLFITSLNSGSNGNCYYIGNDEEAVLVDAGISCKETEKRMRSLGLSMSKVRAIFISHEHIDHVKGAPLLAARYNLPVYITDATWSRGNTNIRKEYCKNFSAYERIEIGMLSVTAFPKHHDAEDPHSFIIDGNNVTIGVFTDIGASCHHVIKHFKQCHAAFLESNYDEQMLEDGRYPYHLKNRIRGGNGHLSNKQALEIFTKHRPPFMTHLLLSHLSRDNNDPQLVQKLFDEQAGPTKIIVASRYEPTAVYSISHNGHTMPAPVIKVKPTQLKLFETV